MSLAALSDWIDRRWPEGRGWELLLQGLITVGTVIVGLATIGVALVAIPVWFVVNFLVMTTSRQRM